MPNGTYGGVRGKETKVDQKTFVSRPTRFLYLACVRLFIVCCRQTIVCREQIMVWWEQTMVWWRQTMGPCKTVCPESLLKIGESTFLAWQVLTVGVKMCRSCRFFRRFS